jgi:DNA excision repair protein ERCC-2
VPEIEKALAELKRLIEFRVDAGENHDNFIGLGLSSRKNLCVHPTVSSRILPDKAKVSKGKEGTTVDSMCRNLTASWVREKEKPEEGGMQDAEDIEKLCSFYEKLQSLDIEKVSGVYTLDDLKEYGKVNGYCPYFLARKLVSGSSSVCQL